MGSHTTPPKVLSIAGFDGSGGAGIQADLKTFSALNCYGMTILTALPVQNTCGIKNCYQIPLQCIQDQLEAIFEDIKPDVIKIGMLFNISIIELVAHFLTTHGEGIPIVLDPVMVAKSGDILLQFNAISCLKERLIPIATILTPNLPEAHALGDKLAKSRDEMDDVMDHLMKLGSSAVLLKGGHLLAESVPDLYADKEGKRHWIEGQRINTRNTHGTGCTLSAAIAANLALGYAPLESCHRAKHYLFSAIQGAQLWRIGLGHGPVNHFYTNSGE